MELADLPQFTVLELHSRQPNGDTVLVGRLSHLRGVHAENGWLYRSGGPSMVGGFDALPSEAGVPVRFITPDAELAPELAPGAVYPWVGDPWQAYHLDMILDGPARWQRRHFSAGPAQYFRLAGVTGWQPVGGPLPEGAEALDVRAGGWDHEHCELCRAVIGKRGTPDGYVNPDDRWLCPACYARFAATRDISFVAEV